MGFSKEEVARALSLAAARIPEAEALVIEATQVDGGSLSVSLAGNCAVIEAPDQNALIRGVFLSALALARGEGLALRETRHFQDCGVMLDLSRGAVMKLESLKAVMEAMALLGMNYLQLYMEDVYPIEGYPYFGYLRGRYSAEELREADRYASSLGIEVVASIQTLGHLGQFLQWQENAALRDQPAVLLIDDERTYALIEAQIRACASLLSSRRIHIGMDEADGVGLGRYFALHGLEDRFALLCRHLQRVCAIAETYGLSPMMWSDMFFRLGSKTGSYYDIASHVPDEVIQAVPNVRLCYWDYYNRDAALISHMFREHERIHPDTVFTGGIWTWSGFLPQLLRTYETSAAALPLCLENGVTTVIASMWGDDGAECSPFLALPLLTLFSEACWQGKVPTLEEALRLGEAACGVPKAAVEAMAMFYNGWEDTRGGKSFLYGDLLYPLEAGGEAPERLAPRFREGEARMLPYAETDFGAFAKAVFALAAHKAELCACLRERYLAGDREYLEAVAEREIPLLIGETRSLLSAHRALWKKRMKPNGWEVLVSRYGACMERYRDVADEIREYLSGERKEIAALEEKPLPPNRTYGHFYTGCVFPSAGPL
ncbi:MAG: family 20 glycosylhydrolase [Clostridia bacterium]|nr:family 20 glycosylhydrolase [Clostridia bacterium]